MKLILKNFTNCFSNLNKADNNLNEFHKDILKRFHAMKNKLHQSNFLEPEITINEIKTAFKSEKWEKSLSTDVIANEMLKHGGYLMLNSLGKLFNFILNSGTFPQSWNEGYLVLLYKSGNKLAITGVYQLPQILENLSIE